MSMRTYSSIYGYYAVYKFNSVRQLGNQMTALHPVFPINKMQTHAV